MNVVVWGGLFVVDSWWGFAGFWVTCLVVGDLWLDVFCFLCLVRVVKSDLWL